MDNQRPRRIIQRPVNYIDIETGKAYTKKQMDQFSYKVIYERTQTERMRVHDYLYKLKYFKKNAQQQELPF